MTKSKFHPNYDEWTLLSVIKELFSHPQVRYSIDGRKLGHIRSVLGITQVKLAKILGITAMAMHKIENGHIATMERKKIILCMEAFKKGFIKRLKQCGYSDEELGQFKWRKPKLEEIE